MQNTGRYNTYESSEAEYQPGSGDSVLKNLLEITSTVEMEQVETTKFVELSEKMIFSLPEDKRFDEKDIIAMHHDWLKDAYSWAGHYRQVNMSKVGFTFAAAHLVPKLMKEFEKSVLTKYTPCVFKSEDELLTALAVVHVEFVLIHPFREGNGRLARLLSQLMSLQAQLMSLQAQLMSLQAQLMSLQAQLMSLQAQLPLLDFSIIAEEQKEAYFSAIRQGLGSNYEPMKVIFSEIIAASR